MTFLCVVTWLVGVSTLFAARDSKVTLRRLSSGAAVSVVRWHTAGVVLGKTVGATIVIASMLLAARNAGLL